MPENIAEHYDISTDAETKEEKQEISPAASAVDLASLPAEAPSSSGAASSSGADAKAPTAPSVSSSVLMRPEAWPVLKPSGMTPRKRTKGTAHT